MCDAVVWPTSPTRETGWNKSSSSSGMVGAVLVMTRDSQVLNRGTRFAGSVRTFALDELGVKVFRIHLASRIHRFVLTIHRKDVSLVVRTHVSRYHVCVFLSSRAFGCSMQCPRCGSFADSSSSDVHQHVPMPRELVSQAGSSVL
jgi:hypothetical protein